MAGFKMDDYVDVAERIRLFSERFPDGCLQSELEALRNAEGGIEGWFCRAFAYRTAEDERPGMGPGFGSSSGWLSVRPCGRRTPAHGRNDEQRP